MQQAIYSFIHLLFSCVSFQSLVGELRQAQDTNLNHYMVWKTLGGLPEILDILEGMPKQNYESYHLRPGV